MESKSWVSDVCALELKEADLRSDLAMIEVPTLIVHGTSDKICLFDLAKFMHDGIKESRFVPVENAGHGFYYEEKEKLNT